MSRLEWLRRQVDEIEGDLDAAREDGSHQAVAALHRRLSDARNALDKEQPAPLTLEDMSEEEFLEHLERSVREWPDQYCELVGRVYADRYRVSAGEGPE